MKSSLALSITLGQLLWQASVAFAPTNTNVSKNRIVKLSTSSSSLLSSADDEFSRRDVLSRSASAFFTVAAAASTGLVAGPDSALAYAQEAQDKQNMVAGYKRLTYFIDNWEKETTVCGRFDNPYIGNNGCERTPEKVMEYLGFKSMKDPLFRADKTMQRLQTLVKDDDEIDYRRRWKLTMRSQKRLQILHLSVVGEKLILEGERIELRYLLKGQRNQSSPRGIA
eukprot:928415_1